MTVNAQVRAFCSGHPKKRENYRLRDLRCQQSPETGAFVDRDSNTDTYPLSFLDDKW
jgi:hypothetical protein